MPETLIPVEYMKILTEIKHRIKAAQYEAFKAVNRELIALYWDIGSMIVARQQGETWGKSIVEKLAVDLQAEFPGVSGFSVQNLWRMKQFYEKYSVNEKLSLLVREISWTNNLVIMSKCKDGLECEYYIRMAKKFGWSKNILLHNVENKTYEKTLLSQTNFEQVLPEEIQRQLKLAVKDEYAFDFLELGDMHSERQLEQAILSRVEPFLREMGGMFTFVGSQYRLEVGDKEYFIDILLYHRPLKCLVALELKIGEFMPEYVGKMQFYLALLDDKVKMPDENPSVGIILCKYKDKMIVEYALRDVNKPIGISTYKIVSQLPSELVGQLPDPEQVAKLLSGI